MKYELHRQKQTYTSVTDVGPTIQQGDVVVLTKRNGKVRTTYIATNPQTTCVNRCDLCDMSYRSCVYYWFSCGANCVLKKMDNILEDL